MKKEGEGDGDGGTDERIRKSLSFFACCKKLVLDRQFSAAFPIRLARQTERKPSLIGLGTGLTYDSLFLPLLSIFTPIFFLFIGTVPLRFCF